MAEKRLPKYVTMRGFQEHIINWSDDTIRRRIHQEGLPAVKDGKQFLFPTSEVLDWLKRRHIKTG